MARGPRLPGRVPTEVGSTPPALVRNQAAEWSHSGVGAGPRIRLPARDNQIQPSPSGGSLGHKPLPDHLNLADSLTCPSRQAINLGPMRFLLLSGKAALARCIAHDERLRRDVAIKVSNDQFTERFARRAVAYTGRAEGALTQWYTRRLDQFGSTLLPDTTLLDRRRSTRTRRLPSPS
jgi:hypothetical protein